MMEGVDIPNLLGYVSVKEAASLLGISDKRVYQYVMELVRRQFMEWMAQLGLTVSLGDVSLAIVSSPTVDPEEYLAIVGGSIRT